jgi:hypothetical protein
MTSECVNDIFGIPILVPTNNTKINVEF